MQPGAVAAYRGHDFRESDGVCIKHRAAAQNREAVAVQVDEVDVGRALCDALLENPGTLVHQRVHQALDDFAIVDVASGDADFGRVSHDHRIDGRVRPGSAIAGLVIVPTGAG